MTPDERPRVVQFPHPGGEHVPPSDEMPWNVGPHRRKFLTSTGRYLDRRGGSREDVLTFWGEWEPPSRVVRRWPPQDRLPRALHQPYWFRPTRSGPRQNTDPWIWGEQMLYSNCKQIVGPCRLHTAMRHLPPGSVICFGSSIAGDFCIGTVFVVASAEPWVPAEAADLDVSDAFAVCTGGSITAGRTDAHAELVLYRGATPEHPVDSMYSFIPARRANHREPRFARPAIKLTDLINPASKQSTWGSKRPLPPPKVRRAWKSVRQQVIDHGDMIAVHLATPPETGLAHSIAITERARC